MAERSKTFLAGGEVAYFLDDAWSKMLAQWDLDPRRVPAPFELAEQTASQEKRDSQPIVVTTDRAREFVAFVKYCTDAFTEEPEDWRRGALKLAEKVGAWAGISSFTMWESVLAARYLNDRHRLGPDEESGPTSEVRMFQLNGWRIGGVNGPPRASLIIAGLVQPSVSDRLRSGFARLPRFVQLLIYCVAIVVSLTVLLWLIA